MLALPYCTPLLLSPRIAGSQSTLRDIIGYYVASHPVRTARPLAASGPGDGARTLRRKNTLKGRRRRGSQRTEDALRLLALQRAVKVTTSCAGHAGQS